MRSSHTTARPTLALQWKKWFPNSLDMNMMSTVLQVSGAVAVTVGVALLSIPVGVIIGGAFMILIGLALGR